MFFVFKKSKEKVHFLVFVTPPNFVNISIFHTFPRVVRDIVANSCMLSYKCHTYWKRLWSLLFAGISQYDAMYKRNEDKFVSSPKPIFSNFLSISDIFQRNSRNLVKSYPNKLPNGSFSTKHLAITLQAHRAPPLQCSALWLCL